MWSEFPALTRAQALAAWAEFKPHIVDYAATRNHVRTDHRNVSKLSAALRHRLILEQELIDDTLALMPLDRAEKWLQEVSWRRYWKGWLHARPQVWQQFRVELTSLKTNLPAATLQRVAQVSSGNSGVACMDAIARELTETGYLHNHARMWWASFWVHCEGLPWQLGAAFFYQYLLDADAASNTLSWRWVAGLHTPGKTYLVRHSNMAKYAPHLLDDLTGVEKLQDGAFVARVITDDVSLEPTEIVSQVLALPTDGSRFGIWLHSDDLLPELGELSACQPICIAIDRSEASLHAKFSISQARMQSLCIALDDAAQRAALHFQCPVHVFDAAEIADNLASWAIENKLTEVIGFAPLVGPIADAEPDIRHTLQAHGITLNLIYRQGDLRCWAHAGRGFFPFWQAIRHGLQAAQTSIS